MKKWLASDLEDVIHKALAGWTDAEIANSFGVSVYSIKGRIAALRKKGLLPKRNNWQHQEIIGAKNERKRRNDPASRGEIEDPPKAVPKPPGAKFKPWVDLEPNECQWHMDDGMEGFFNKPSNSFPCCGLEVDKRHKFCNYHLRYSRKGK